MNNFGVYNSDSAPTIYQNQIYSDSSNTNSYGIANYASSDSVIKNNIINGGFGSSNNYTISNDSSSPVITNNTLNCGASGLTSFMIYNNNNSNPVITNNIFLVIFALSRTSKFPFFTGGESSATAST